MYDKVTDKSWFELFLLFKANTITHLEIRILIYLFLDSLN